jgi:putative hydrolase of the HAD superfamily
MNTNNITAVLFDVDDTLFDRKLAQQLVLELIVKQLPHVFEGYAKERVLQAFIESDRITTEKFNEGAPSAGSRDKRSQLFMQLLGIEGDLAPTLTALYVKDYPLVKAPVAGAIPTVNKLSREFKLGVVSNGFPDVQYRKLETMGLLEIFSCIVLSEELCIRKPDTGIFKQATILMHVQPSECLYVGDSFVNDVIGAKNAGMQTCWFNPDSLQPADKNYTPDFTIQKLDELPGLLKNIST